MQAGKTEQFFSKKLIDLDADFSSQDDFFKQISTTLKQLGYVRESYLPNILVREQEYPTGLVTATLNIAIPHTDPQHIIKPFIAVTRLKKPLIFMEMGTVDEPVAVEWIFSLGVTQADEQIFLLQKLMQFFSQPAQVNQLTQLVSSEQVYEFLKQNMNK